MFQVDFMIIFIIIFFFITSINAHEPKSYRKTLRQVYDTLAKTKHRANNKKM
jgi:large-conductance mechanosensitive channel